VKARAVRGLFDTVSPRYDLVNRVMTFGMDVGWRRRAVRELRLPGGALVADLACGTCDL
jgi:demethylmenaquinone methyltransferase/2-methoxy-6-polyprenyl-1,4-benzoquinol methylase